MPTYARIVEDCRTSSQRLSAQIRIIAGGVLATVFAFIVEGGAANPAPFLPTSQVAGPAALALLGLGVDLANLIIAYVRPRQLELKTREHKQTADYPQDMLAGLMDNLFWGKVVLVAAAAGWLVLMIGSRVWEMSG